MSVIEFPGKPERKPMPCPCGAAFFPEQEGGYLSWKHQVFGTPMGSGVHLCGKCFAPVEQEMFARFFGEDHRQSVVDAMERLQRFIDQDPVRGAPFRQAMDGMAQELARIDRDWPKEGAS